MIYTRSMAVIVLVGTAVAQAQDRGGVRLLPRETEQEAEARVAEAEENYRLAVARLVLYEKSGVLAEGFDLRFGPLGELFARTRQILRDVHEGPAVHDVEEGIVVDLLLSGRDGMDPGAEVRADRSELIEELPEELERPGHLFVAFVGTELKPLASTLSKLAGTPSQFRVAAQLETETVSVRAKETNYREILDLVTEDSGITYGVRGGVVVFVAPDRRPESMEQIHRFAREVITALGILGQPEAERVLRRMLALEDRQIAVRAQAALRQIRR